MEDNSKIFRKKSLDRLSSPEQLDDYIRVITPKTWVFMAAVIIFLFGVICFGVLGRIERTIQGVAVVANGEIKMYVSSERISEINESMKIVINNQSFDIKSIDDKPMRAFDIIDTYSIDMAKFDYNTWVYEISADAENDVDLIDTSYQAYIVVEKINPYKYVLN